MPDIAVEHVTKQYDGKLVLKDLSFYFAAGGSYALMAPSGAGKTTLFRLLLGLEQPDNGTIRFFAAKEEVCLEDETSQTKLLLGRETQKETQCNNENHRCFDMAQDADRLQGALQKQNIQHGSEIPREQVRFAAVFQEDRLCEGFGGAENLRLCIGGTKQAARALFHLLLPEEDPNKPVFFLSGGQRRRVALLRALFMPGAQILIMDEPFAGLDDASKQKAAALILEQKKHRTLLMSTHDKADTVLLNLKQVHLNG